MTIAPAYLIVSNGPSPPGYVRFCALAFDILVRCHLWTLAMKFFALFATFLCSVLAEEVTKESYPTLYDEIYMHVQHNTRDATEVYAKIRLRWDKFEYVHFLFVLLLFICFLVMMMITC